MGLGFKIIKEEQDPNQGRVDINYNFAILSGVTAINLTGATSGATTFDIVTGSSINGILTLETFGGSTFNIDIPKVSNRVISGFSSSYTSGSTTQLNVDVGSYVINDFTYTTTAETQFNLVSGSSEYDRIDAIVGDSLSNVFSISGTPNQSPVSPSIPDSKVIISYVKIPGDISKQVFNGSRTVKRSGLPAINAGGETLTQWVENYFFPFIPATLSINSHSLQEVGTIYSPSITYNITLNDEEIVTAGRILNVTSGTTIHNVTPASADTNFNASDVTTDNTWKNESDVDNNGSPTTISSSNSSVSFIYPWFYGKVASGGAASGVNRPSSDQTLIDSGTKTVSSSNGTLTVAFNSTSDDYLWFAIPSTSTSKTKWYVDALNNGSIGGSVSAGGNLFPDFDLVSVDSPTILWNGIDYKIYVSNFQTESSTIQLINS